MNFEFKYIKSATALSIRHFSLLIFFVIIYVIPSYQLIPKYPLLQILYLITVSLYIQSGVYGFICHHYNENLLPTFLIKSATKYYIQYIKTILVIVACMLFITIVLAFFMIFYIFISSIIVSTQLDSTTMILIFQISLRLVMSILTVYMIPFLFVYNVRNGSAVRYGFRYLRFVIKNRKNEFFTLLMLILINSTIGIVTIAYFNTPQKVIAMTASIVSGLIYIFIFLVAATHLMSDTNAKQIASVKEEDIFT